MENLQSAQAAVLVLMVIDVTLNDISMNIKASVL